MENYQTNNWFSFTFKLFKIKSLSIYQLTLIIIIISSVLSIMVIAAGWAISEKKRLQKEISKLKSTAIEKQEEQLHQEVLRLISYLEYTQQDTIQHSQEELKEKALHYFETIRFGNDGYVFVNTYSGDALLFSGKKLEEPKKMSEIQRLKELNLYEIEMNLAKRPNGGSFQYDFFKINDSIPYPKISYVMGFEKWGWILGAGDYLDNLDYEIMLMEKALKNNLYRGIALVIIIFIPILIILLLFSSLTAKFIQKQFNKFIFIIKKSLVDKENQHQINQLFIRDLKLLAKEKQKQDKELQKSEEKLKLAQSLTHETIENMLDGFVSLDKNWNYTFVNRQAANMFGRKPSELVGKHIWTEFPEGVGQPFYHNYYKVVETQQQISFEEYYQPWDRWFENRVIPTKEGIAIFFHDITERIKTSKALKSSEQRFVTFMNNTSALAWIKDENLNYIFLNKAYEAQFNITLEAIKGKDDFAIFDKETAEQLRKNDLLVLETNQLLETEEIVKDNKGHVFHYLINKFTIQAESGKTFVGGMAINITQQIKANEKILKLNAALEERVAQRTIALRQNKDALLNMVDDLNINQNKLEIINKKLAEINTEMETFAYSVSHDLKAPLRGIDGYSKLLLDSHKKDLNPEAIEFIHKIRSGTKQMNELIEDLLAYSRMERRDFFKAEIPLKPFIQELLVPYLKITEEKQLTINLLIPDDIRIDVDKEGLKLVLRNLIDNAIKFTHHTQQPTIEIGASQTETHYKVYVKDNGVGFDMKYHDRIFKIFQRLHLQEEYEGTGIGLAMVAKAVQRMNGTVWAESILGEGASFFIEFKK